MLFDLDGVLSDARGRQHFLEGGSRKDWRSFFDACGDDPVIGASARLLELLRPDLTVVLLTGRPLRVRDLTIEWLERHELRWDLLVMREGGSYAAAPEFKRDSVGELRRRAFELCLAFDDDARIVEMFHEEHVPCVYIHSGYYE